MRLLEERRELLSSYRKYEGVRREVANEQRMWPGWQEHRSRKETKKYTMNASVVSSCGGGKPVKTRRTVSVVAGPPARADM